MLDVKKRIQVISDLLAQSTPESITYAALECRLAIEYLCYERLQMSLEHVSLAELKAWQPSKVVRAVEELANEEAAISFTLSFAPEPALAPGEELTLEERKNLAYVLLGTQSAINLKKIATLWNALANAALHVHLPKTKSESMSIYGDANRTSAKVEECLAELRLISSGTLLSNGWGREVSFTCAGCDYRNKRRIEKIVDGQSISCVNPDCIESYVVEKRADDDFSFTRRSYSLECKKCNQTMDIAARRLENFKMPDKGKINCPQCGAHHIIKAELAYALVESALS
jgi:hypothetical protein